MTYSKAHFTIGDVRLADLVLRRKLDSRALVIAEEWQLVTNIEIVAAPDYLWIQGFKVDTMEPCVIFKGEAHAPVEWMLTVDCEMEVWRNGAKVS